VKILNVDLSRHELTWQEISDEVLSGYLGGRGLGARYLYDHLAPGVDPLGPDNLLTFWTSPLMGTGAISMVKLCGVTKSPATGTILMSLMGGYFGPELRFAGADGMVVRGVAAEPVYLLLQDGKAELKSAEHLWGKTTRQTESALKDELESKKIQVASIGPAGENLVSFASIMHGGDAMGRGGIGAVMGSKNLKAIVTSGRMRPKVHDPNRYKQTVKRIADFYKDSLAIEMFGEWGTTRHVDGLNAKGIYPTRNYQAGSFEHYQEMNAESLYDTYVTKRVTCHACSVRCRREAAIDHDRYGSVHTEGPEYETLWSFGGNCGNNSLEAVIAANDLCLEYGLDTISTGMVISFAMECFERGLISVDRTDGVELRFGNHEAMVEMTRKIAQRDGFGDLLAQGVQQAARQIGGGAENYAIHVKGLELAGYEPRAAKGMGLGYATSPRGGCHERGYTLEEILATDPKFDRHKYEGKGTYVKTKQDEIAVKDALGFCVLSSAGTTVADFAELFSTSTGIDMDEPSLRQAGERIWNLERLFNLREGFTRKDDTLPRRLVKEAIKGKDGKLHTVDIERLLDDYYAARGWDQEGVPLPETLERLGLNETD